MAQAKINSSGGDEHNTSNHPERMMLKHKQMHKHMHMYKGTKVKKAIKDGCGFKGFSTSHRISQNNLQNFTEYAIKETSVKNRFSKIMILKNYDFS